MAGNFLSKCGVQDSDIREALSFSHGVWEAVQEDILVKDRIQYNTIQYNTIQYPTPYLS
jgi:hypothetical protein